MEILAPVGTLENLKIAIAHGADAVYFSAGQFNARAKCQDINLDNLKECVNFAHLFNVKVYLTVNTIIKNSEINNLIKFLDCAVNAKVDAFIIQDLAVYYILKNRYSDVVIHASTQMGVHNLDGAKFLEKLGFKRVVLARETTLEDIKLIHKYTNLEIEYFVQGALCVAFSGNCYLSSIENNKSGNRGECLQLCRLKYSAFDDNKEVKDGYLLSPSDLCLIKKLNELENAGVCSLKIEGRLRRGAYVAQAIDSYKKALFTNVNLDEEIEKSKKVFNRGNYNQGKYLYCDKDVINPIFQNHIGVNIGKVTSVKPFKNLYKICICSKNHEIVLNDGLKFINGNNQVSVGVGNVDKNGNKYTIYSIKKPSVDCDVYLTCDYKQEEYLCNKQRKLKVDVVVNLISGEFAHIQLCCNNIKVDYYGDKVDTAKSCPLSCENVKNTFNKINDTNFEIANIKINLSNAFVVKSKLNSYKRQAFMLLQEKIIENYNKNIKSKIKNEFSLENINKKYTEKKENYYIFNDKNQIKNINSENNIFIYSPLNYQNEIIKKEINLIPKNYELYLNLPTVANYKDIEIIDEILKENSRFVGVMINNYWGMKYCKKYKTILSYTMNIANDIAKNILLEYADDFIQTIEPKLAKDFFSGVAYSGKASLMTFVHCPQKTCFKKQCSKDCVFNNITYKSESGKSYQIRRTKIAYCYFELLKNLYINNNQARQCKDLR